VRSVNDIPNLPVKTAFLDTSTLGSNALVAAVSGKQIVVLSLAVVTTLANNVKFLSDASQISSTMPVGANGGFVLPFHQYGWCATNIGEALNINLSAAVFTGITITYIEK
jgi:hypothetical protein